MDILKELVNIITPSRLKKLSTLANLPKDTKLMQFYYGLIEKNWKTEEEAMQSLYGEGYNKNTYYKLKHDLMAKIMTTIPLINLVDNEHRERKKQMFECYTIYYTGMLIAQFTPATKAGCELIAKVFPKMCKLEMVDILPEAARILSYTHYRRYNINLKKALEMEELSFAYYQLYLVELKGNIYYGNIMAAYSANKSEKKEMPALILRYLDELKGIKTEIQSQRQVFYIKALEVCYYMCQYDYRNTLQHCEEAIAFFEQAEQINSENLRFFYYQAIISHTYLKEYGQGRIKIEQCLNYVLNSSANWFKVHLLSVQLALYAKAYQEACEITEMVLNHTRFAKLPNFEKENWQLQLAYLSILTPVYGLKHQLPSVRLKKFLNEVPTYERDKKGMNIGIRLFQNLYLIQEKQYDKLFDRLESFEKYGFRYLEEEALFRSKLIFQLFLLLPKHGFNAKTIKKDPDMTRYLTELKTIAYDITDPNKDLEVLPFEDVFELALVLMEGQQVRKSVR